MLKYINYYIDICSFKIGILAAIDFLLPDNKVSKDMGLALKRTVRREILVLAFFVWLTPFITFGSDNSIKVIKTSPEYGAEIDSSKTLLIIIQFNREMDPSMAEDFLMDQRGITDENGDPIEILGEITWPNAKTLQFKPNQLLRPNATYQVSLFSVRTKEGEEMEGTPYRLAFMTVKK